MNHATFNDTDKGREFLSRNNPEVLGLKPKTAAPRRSKTTGTPGRPKNDSRAKMVPTRGDQIRQANEFLRELSKMKRPK